MIRSPGLLTRVGSASRSDTYTGTTTGTAITLADRPVQSFGIQVKGTGAAPTSWTVVLEGSLDGTNFSTILSHTNNSPGDGGVLWLGAAKTPSRYMRSRCSALALGSATDIVATIIGME